ncbi:MAG: Lrp/AsnC ligand binding domain-containing protein [Flavobacteriales bacterium]
MDNLPDNYEIDKLDRDIISILMKDATESYTEIARKLTVSPGTIHVRMRKLTAIGAVVGSSLVVNPALFGFDLNAYLGIFLEKGSQYNKVIRELKKIPEVLEASYTTGQYSIFARIVCRNTRHMREVLNEKIQPIQGIQSTETFLILEESIRRQVVIQ